MRKIYLCLLLLIFAHLFILTKLQFTAWPEMLSFPYMVDKGFLIYKDFHHVYQPVLTFVLAFYYKFAGFSVISLKIFTWALIILIDFSVFILSKEIFGKKFVSLIPLTVFVILQPAFEGNMLWFDLTLSLPLVISIYFLFRKKFFWSGLVLSIGFLIKQQAAIFLIPFLLHFIFNKLRLKNFVNFAFGGLIPLLSILIFLLIKEDLKDYLFWTFILPMYWLPRIPGYKVLPMPKEWETLLIMVFAPVFAFFLGSKKETKLFFLFFIFILALISAFPRFSFFHLQPALAIFSVICGFLLTNKNKLIIFASMATLIFIGVYRWNLTGNEFNNFVRFYDDSEIHLAQRVGAVTSAKDKVYLLGPNSLVYVIADRIPPKPWIENYLWHFEIPGIQEKVISGWGEDPPKVIFWTPPEPGNWYDLGTYQPKEIVDWIRMNYVHKEDTKSGIQVWYKK